MAKQLLREAAAARRERVAFLIRARKAIGEVPAPRFVGGLDEPPPDGIIDLLAEDDFLVTYWTRAEGLVPTVVSADHLVRMAALSPWINPAVRN